MPFDPSEVGLGRIEKVDLRDAQYPVERLLGSPPAAGKKAWDARYWWGNQGNTSQCVAYTYLHRTADLPVLRKPRPFIDPTNYYNRAQAIDTIPLPHEGTTIRAGAKVAVELGLASSYYWCQSLNDIVRAVLYDGPVAMGTKWLWNMFFPNANSGILNCTGEEKGGHAYKVDAIDTRAKIARIKNSWGRGWARSGHAYIRFADLEELLHDNGEACVISESPAR